ncbi:MAG TPA: transposase [Bryobacteraceae bacterium]|jgi:hypothetical protein|nr:transposase [Bryobacteraceae bacterium]
MFGTTTPDLRAILEWLQHSHVESAAMESTGRQTDIEDCQWIQLLHSYGLLQGCFRPADIIMPTARAGTQQGGAGGRTIGLAAAHAEEHGPDERAHRAVSDINGTTGMAMLRAIVAGERDPVQLVKLRDPRCRQSQQMMVKELTGTWHGDHLFDIEQALKMYDTLSERIGDYQREIQRRAEQLRSEKADRQPLQPMKNKEKAKAIKRRGQEPMRRVLHGMTGVDLTSIDGIGVETAEVFLSEYGPDLHEFDDERQFVRRVRLAPRQAISGGKPLRKGKGQKGRYAYRPSAQDRSPLVAAQPHRREQRYSHGGCLPRHVSWRSWHTACCTGAKPMWTRVPLPTSSVTRLPASDASPPQPGNLAINWCPKRRLHESLTYSAAMGPQMSRRGASAPLVS